MIVRLCQASRQIILSKYYQNNASLHVYIYLFFLICTYTHNDLAPSKPHYNYLSDFSVSEQQTNNHHIHIPFLVRGKNYIPPRSVEEGEPTILRDLVGAFSHRTQNQRTHRWFYIPLCWHYECAYVNIQSNNISLNKIDTSVLNLCAKQMHHRSLTLTFKTWLVQRGHGGSFRLNPSRMSTWYVFLSPYAILVLLSRIDIQSH